MTVSKVSFPSRRKLAVATFAALSALVLSLGKPAARWADTHLLHEQLRDLAGHHVHHEDWSPLPPLPEGLSRQWLEASVASNSPLRIAHALGEADSTKADSLEAYQRAAERGFRIFEVDLYLDEAGRLRCHHGPEAPPPFGPNTSCTLERLLDRLPTSDAWLVLDIKSDFRATAERVLAAGAARGRNAQLIYQLYRPSDYAWFHERAAASGAPAPLITAYLSHRSGDYLRAQAARLRVPVLTLPIERLPALSAADSQGPLIFTHPVHQCTQYLGLPASPAIAGLYMLSRFDPQSCKP